jgi:hypothetical protein
MSDFIFAALPWIALGITVAVVVANNSSGLGNRGATKGHKLFIY